MDSLESLKKNITDLFNWSTKPQQPNNTQPKSENVSPAGEKIYKSKSTKSQKQTPTTKNGDKINTTIQRKPQQSMPSVLSYLKNILIQEQLSCPICLTKYKKPGMIQMCTCKHYYCAPCLREYINTKIATFSLPKCPQQSCNSSINKQTAFFKSLNTRTKSLVTRIEKFYYTSNDPYLRMCPSQNCEGIIPLIEGQPCKCSICHKQFCVKCMYIKHEGKCEKNQVSFLNNKYSYRKCNKCSIIVEKSQACNHMTCKCGYEFCYGCGRKWAGSHHCPPKKPTTVKKTNSPDQSQSKIMKLFKFCGQVLLTILLLSGVALYACTCLLPMMLLTLACGVLMGMLIYSFKFIYDTCKKQSPGLGVLLIICFPIAMGFGICEAFKAFWGQGFLFWWEVLRQTIEKPLGLIWN